MPAMTAPARRDANHQAHAAALHFSPQSSSPTLTNPDMILPDYAHPESVVDALPWTTATRSSIADFNFFPSAPLDNSSLLAVTPIIYGNGTTLSDIGEVTEVESSPGGPLSRLSGNGSDGTPLGSSPTTGKRAMKKRITYTRVTRERRLSLDSTSTVHDPDRTALSKDLDDALSVDDSNFQGDDEDSMASSYADDARPQHPSSGLVATPNRYSTASISKRAEQILANAKRRLNTMEGNLNRARTFSYSSISSDSNPSSAAISANAPLPQNTLPPSQSGSVIETTRSSPVRPSTQLQRSASALGAAGGYRPPISPPDRHSGAPEEAKQPSHLGSRLATLSEDNDSTSTAAANDEHDKPPSLLPSPTVSQSSDAASTPSISASAAQVRTLQEQVQGLKGKISSLKEQARADSMRRRSLQNLRTPSPFTHARWDQASRCTPSTGQISSLVPSPLSGTGSKSQHSPQSSPRSGRQEKEQVVTERYDSAEGSARCVNPEENLAAPLADKREATEDDGNQSGDKTETGDDNDYGDDDNGDDNDSDSDVDELEKQKYKRQSTIDSVSESGDSLYHDTLQHPISHEDREDAFDYERFFLHSAMGTISRQARIGHGDSDSDDSVETTRGPILSRARRPSLDTFTTIDSFATATEGRISRNSARWEEQSRHTSLQHARAEAAQEQGEDKETEFNKTQVDQDEPREQDEPPRSFPCGSDDSYKTRKERPQQISIMHRPLGSNSTLSTVRRPSVSSFESSGTNRSFPLVNRTRMSGGILTPIGSPEHDLKHVAESLMTETASICDKESLLGGGPQSPALQMLSREDQVLIEQVVAGLGRCVLGLTETSRSSVPGAEAEFRRRIVAAKRALESSQ
ncbi:hypothetical protein CDD82_1220 [Ophiocordyceps australis]|uniref:Uncharacterized protein n=1 Tax=Ophiocordyceps australis TaxID=1399860 RepID=A0A2C5ZN38_9HYPO|nr:hypothetical protein CDD82_1220 [Ophiocordyceps australis]